MNTFSVISIKKNGTGRPQRKPPKYVCIESGFQEPIGCYPICMGAYPCVAPIQSGTLFLYIQHTSRTRSAQTAWRNQAGFRHAKAMNCKPQKRLPQIRCPRMFFILTDFHHLHHYEGLRLIPFVCDQKWVLRMPLEHRL